jgi:hypothetical protein
MLFINLQKKSLLWIKKPLFIPIFLLILSILSYGLLIPWLHLYIDDWIWHWTWERMGTAGLVKYFSTNRPIWGYLYQITLSFLYPSIIGYHLFALIIRWASGLVSWWFFSLLWPNRPYTAFWGAMLFLLYPGFSLQPIALTYSHIFIVYIFFILSLCLNLLAISSRRRFWIYTAVALVLSLANLSMMEFFFTLEIARPFILWVVIKRKTPSYSLTVKRTLFIWSPYLLIFAGVLVWRTFFFRFQNYRYHFDLLSQIKIAPTQTLLRLVSLIADDISKVSLGAWWPSIDRITHLKLTLATGMFTLLLIVSVTALIWLVFMIRRTAQPDRDLQWAWKTLTLGLITMLVAGWPFWLTGLSVQLFDFKSRFTLPFIIGAVITCLGLVEFIKPRHLQAGILALALGIASGYHFQIANDFRLDWNNDQQLFWQLVWRAPDIREGTSLLLTDFPILYYNYAAYSTEVASLYPKEDNNNLPYSVLYVRELDQAWNGKLTAGLPIHNDNVTSFFTGNTSQSLMIKFDLSRCVRLLDQNFDTSDKTLSGPEQRGAALSNLNWVLVDRPDGSADTRWFGNEPAHTWCYYFEKAELARQRGDWQSAANLGDEATSLGYSARDEMEKLVFIEAYAHVGRWNRAVELSEGFNNDSERPMLCLLWKRIEQQTTPGEMKTKSLQVLAAKNICP